MFLDAVSGGEAQMQCIGPGEATRDPEKQAVLIDLANPGPEGRIAAAGCIIAAAAESGW